MLTVLGPVEAVAEVEVAVNATLKHVLSCMYVAFLSGHLFVLGHTVNATPSLEACAWWQGKFP